MHIPNNPMIPFCLLVSRQADAAWAETVRVVLSRAADVQQLTARFLQRAVVLFSSLQKKVSWLFGSSAARLTTASLFVCFTLSSQQTDNQSFRNKCRSDQVFTSAEGKFQLHTQRRFLLLSISLKPLTCTNTDEESSNNSYCNSDLSWEESAGGHTFPPDWLQM